MRHSPIFSFVGVLLSGELCLEGLMTRYSHTKLGYLAKSEIFSGYLKICCRISRALMRYFHIDIEAILIDIFS